ncbi:transposable element Tcb2 transposase [Trichonephila clavipes]|nr:transposable element Tcb2 transposase [Trichonephila clavipes]
MCDLKEVLRPVDQERCHLQEDQAQDALDRRRREDHHIVRNARMQPTASWTAIQTVVAPSLGSPMSSRTIRRRLAEERLESRRPLRVLPLTPTHRRLSLEWCRVRKLDCSGMEPDRL